MISFLLTHLLRWQKRNARQKLIAQYEKSLKFYEKIHGIYFRVTIRDNIPKLPTYNFEFNSKNRISISELQSFRVHTDKFLLCRVITRSVFYNSLTTIIEDPEGNAEKLSLYNWVPLHKIPANGLSIKQASKILPIGMILAIRDPYYKIGLDGLPFIRSDNPSEIKIVRPNDKLLSKIKWETDTDTSEDTKSEKQKASVDDFRVHGNECFENEDFESAIDEYSRGIELYPHDVRLYANRAEAHLRLKQYKKALEDAETALKIDPNHLKANVRKGKALYQLKQYKEAVKIFNNLHESMKSDEPKFAIMQLLNHSQNLYFENMSGIYDYYKIINESLREYKKEVKGPRLEHADYTTDAIKIKYVGTKGRRGWVAERDIPKHTLLMASKAFEIVYDYENPNFLHKDYINRMLINTGLIASIAQRILAEPELAREIYKLYSGPNLIPGEKLDENSLKGVDIKRIEEIVRYNAFKSEDIFRNFRNSVNSKNLIEYPSGSGLWTLPSYFNHSCIDTNVGRIFIGDLMFLRTLSSIKKGEELTLPYVDPMDENRTSSLASFGINCQCRLCQLERAESIETKQQRAIILKRFESNIKDKILLASKIFSVYAYITELERMIEELRSLRTNNQDLDFSSIPLKFALLKCYYLTGKPTQSIAILMQIYEIFKQNNFFYLSYSIAFQLSKLYSNLGQSETAKKYFNVGLYEMASFIIGDFDIENIQKRNDALQIVKTIIPDLEKWLRN
ncbi:7751_t:CDS:1 [Ambispora leptoticha]|uniref:7751_t:CDS:1 n=1 Tax=Ambispora leptoticha TaxID=144679 RepID=A0A9N8Z4Q6_9GLOM|nr:7751_t:CDS:1 [Ambispora leptoticha]